MVGRFIALGALIGLALVTAPAGSAEEPSVEQQRLAEVKVALEGTTWRLELTPEDGGKSQQDTITFSGGKISSEVMAKSGYTASNYSLSVKPDGTGVWETMQSDDKDNAAFWRGELHGSSMRGAINKRSGDSTQSFSFAASLISGPPPTTPAAAVPPVPVGEPTGEPPSAEEPAPVMEATPPPPVAAPQTVPPAPPPTTAPAKQRKGWFGW